jgi:tetratricopeptide (TPR) repeat protein
MDRWMNGKVRRVRQTKRAGASRSSESAAGEGNPAAAPTPEDLLHKAMVARSTLSRARWARRGLASRAPLDKTTHAMLLRQLYLSYYEERRFEHARATALEALSLGVLADVIHQDAARAALGAGDLGAAVAHLRVAARRSPPSRRCFHHWTLGSVFFLAGRYAESAGALERAVRWATRDKPLYRAHYTLVRIAAGEQVDDLRDSIEELAIAPCGQGYGRFVLGHLSYAAGAWESARRFLEAFIERTENSRPELALSLDGELKMSRATLAKISAN